MTETPTAPAAAEVAVGPVGQVVSADVVLAGRAVSAGEYLAGLIAAAELDTVGTPRKLPMDLWPDADPVLVQEVWERALVVGVRAGRLMSAPRFHRDKLARLRAVLAEAGFAAMAGLVGAPLSVADRVPEWHPGDAEDGREH